MKKATQKCTMKSNAIILYFFYTFLTEITFTHQKSFSRKPLLLRLSHAEHNYRLIPVNYRYELHLTVQCQENVAHLKKL